MISQSPKNTPPKPPTILDEWRKSRRCRACANPITTGPWESCVNNHRYELSMNDLQRPYTARWRRLYEQGYWLRWSLGLFGAIMLMICVVVIVILITAGLAITTNLVWLICITGVVVLAGLLLSPPILHAPTSERIERESKASAP